MLPGNPLLLSFAGTLARTGGTSEASMAGSIDAVFSCDKANAYALDTTMKVENAGYIRLRITNLPV
mgnify:CR=1 FL=1